MNLTRGYTVLFLFMLLAFLSSCFEEDERIQPHVQGDELTYSFGESMYTMQSFFDLGTNELVYSGPNSAWSIAFACGMTEWHIIVNSADYWGIYRTASTEMSVTVTATALDEWRFDKSDGNPDSTAIGEWVLIQDTDTSYTNEVYILGKYNGIAYAPLWKFRFVRFDRESYRFVCCPYGSLDSSLVTITKDPAYNYIYYDMSEGGEVVMHAPPKDQWDLQFTQYGSIIYTSDGIPTPYFVRGVLLNPNNVQAVMDTLNDFADISYDSLQGYTFSKNRDVIGYEWKDVTVDLSSNTAVYQVKAENNYIIRDTEGFCYKLRFVSFYNDLGEKGYPVFEYVRL